MRRQAFPGPDVPCKALSPAGSCPALSEDAGMGSAGGLGASAAQECG